MGESITLFDGTVFDVEYNFPSHLKTVALSMSGGVESTLLLKFLIERYGKDNILVVTGGYEGRRSWEAVNTAQTLARLGVKQHLIIPQSKPFMSAQDNYQMYLTTKKRFGYDGWFNGTNAKLFSSSNVTSAATVERLRSDNHFLPFVFLKKQHTIDLYYQKGWEEDLYLSFSCTERADIHCGKCYCCHERVRGFATAHRRDMAPYNVRWDEMLNECFHSDDLLFS